MLGISSAADVYSKLNTATPAFWRRRSRSVDPPPCAVCLGRSDGADVMALPSPPKHPTHTHSAREPRCWHWDPCAHRLCTPAIDYCHPLARTYTLRQTRSVRNVRECVYVWVCVYVCQRTHKAATQTMRERELHNPSHTHTEQHGRKAR